MEALKSIPREVQREYYRLPVKVWTSDGKFWFARGASVYRADSLPQVHATLAQLIARESPLWRA